MRKRTFWTATLAILTACFVVQIPANENVYSQGRGNVTPEVVARRNAIETELQSVAIIERKLMVPMRDGKRMATDAASHTASWHEVSTVAR